MNVAGEFTGRVIFAVFQTRHFSACRDKIFLKILSNYELNDKNIADFLELNYQNKTHTNNLKRKNNEKPHPFIFYFYP